MIFVTVGTHYNGFERLVRKMDEIAGRLDEKVVMQIGNTPYEPQNCEYFRFLGDFREIEKLNREARVVVCHAGVGSILTALEQGTRVFVVPRLKSLGEHLDDHQCEICKALPEDRGITVVQDTADLERCLRSTFPACGPSTDNRLAHSIKRYLEQFLPADEAYL